VLESDAACTSLSGHSARKSAVLVLVGCYKLTGDNKICEGTDRLNAVLSSGVTSL